MYFRGFASPSTKRSYHTDFLILSLLGTFLFSISHLNVPCTLCHVVMTSLQLLKHLVSVHFNKHQTFTSTPYIIHLPSVITVTLQSSSHLFSQRNECISNRFIVLKIRAVLTVAVYITMISGRRQCHGDICFISADSSIYCVTITIRFIENGSSISYILIIYTIVRQTAARLSQIILIFISQIYNRLSDNQSTF